ncbi:MAG: pyrroline-5-carboxylate reductase [Kiritimatiellae bacterium]|nr:pyrroline-5-carboxylate reductase [Kiritimatiellia bacterium]
MAETTLGDTRIVFVGAGNMAEALVRGLVAAQVAPASNIRVSDIRPERLQHFARQYGVAGTADNVDLVRDAGVVVLAVKPQALDPVLETLRGRLPAEAVVVSICAGVRTDRIERLLGGEVRVVRVMPNTPALVGAAASAVCAGRHAAESDLRMTEGLLAAVGCVVRVAEPQMDAVTALSGSGPAYVCFLIEAMLEAASQMDLEPDLARQLAYATVRGTAKLIEETGLSAGELRERVTSKGGTTAAALNVLGESDAHGTWVKAILAARQRSKELSGD